jgi:hypothetical protein
VLGVAHEKIDVGDAGAGGVGDDAEVQEDAHSDLRRAEPHPLSLRANGLVHYGALGLSLIALVPVRLAQAAALGIAGLGGTGAGRGGFGLVDLARGGCIAPIRLAAVAAGPAVVEAGLGRLILVLACVFGHGGAPW